MDNPDLHNIDYTVLKTKGLQLSETEFNLILNSLGAGVEEAKKYLKVTSDAWPKYNFSSESATLGYSSADEAICLSINLLNQAVARSSQLEFKDQLVMFIPDVFYIVVKYTYWLKLLGREATIHRYQKLGNPMLSVKLPDIKPSLWSLKQLLLSNSEVEARQITDEITVQQGENPIWRSVDTYFAQQFPQFYNKPVEELVKLQKPSFPISYEMEYML